MPLLLLNLARRYWREGSIGVLVLAVGLLVAGWVHDRREFEKARLVYEHPATSTSTTLIAAAGPVRIVTRTIERPTEKVTIVREERGPVTVTTGETKESRPVPLSVALAPARVDRWLLAVQVDDLRIHEAKGYTALAGYSFRNRVDVLAGWGGDGGKLQLGLRF